MNPSFKITGRTMVITVTGDIDHHTSQFLRSKLDTEIIRNSPKRVVFDFSRVNFMDSSGIGVLMGRYKNITGLGGKMVIVSLPPQIRRIFDMSGLGRYIETFDNMENAMAN